MEGITQHTIWDRPFPGKHELRQIYKKRVMALVKHHLPEFYEGRPNASATTENLESFQRELICKLKSLREVTLAYHFLRKVFTQGQHVVGWMPPPLSKMMIVQAQPPVLNDLDFLAATGMEEIIKQVIGTLSQPEKTGALHALLCAISFGHYTGSPRKFLDGIRNATFIHDGSHWLLVDANEKGIRRVIWHADPLSGISIARALTHQKTLRAPPNGEKKKGIHNNRAPSISPLSLDGRKISIRNMTAICRNWHSKRLPAFLCHEKSGIHSSTSLSVNQWERLIFGTCSPTSVERLDHRTKLADATPKYSTTLALFSDHKAGDIIKRLKKMVARKSKEKQLPKKPLVSALEQLISDSMSMNHPVRFLCEFALSLKDRSINTISIRINPLTKLFLLGFEHIRATGEIGSDEWQEWFQFILENNPTNSQSAFADLTTSLRMFNTYLIKCKQVAPGDIDGIPFVAKNKKFANANIVSFREIDLFFSFFDFKNQLPRRQLMEACAAILGFYCGLRASEVLDLMISDLEIHEKKVRTVVVQSTRFHNPKSKSSTRAIPLEDFIPAQLNAPLERLLDLRLKETGGDKSELIFAHPDNRRPHRDTVLNPILNTLKGITQDTELRFHHLRHSFANWFLLRLLAHDYPELIDKRIYALNHPEFSPRRIKKLFGNNIHSAFSSSEVLRCTSERLGHVNTNTTLYSYIHLGEWIRSWLIVGSFKFLEPNDISALCVKPLSTVYENLKRSTSLKVVENWGVPSLQEYSIPRGESMSERARVLVHAIPPIDRLVWEGLGIDAEDIVDKSNNPEKFGPLDEVEHAVLPIAKAVLKNNETRKRRMTTRPLSIFPPRNLEQRIQAIDLYKRIVLAKPDSPEQNLLELHRLYGPPKNFEVRAPGEKEAVDIIHAFTALGYSLKDHVTIRLALTTGCYQDYEAHESYWHRVTKVPIEHIYRHSKKNYAASAHGSPFITLMDWPGGKPRKGTHRANPLGEPLHFALELAIRMKWIQSQ